MNLSIQISVHISPFSYFVYIEVVLLNNMVIISLIFRGTIMLFSVVASHLTVPSVVHKGFDFFKSLSTLTFSV